MTTRFFILLFLTTIYNISGFSQSIIKNTIYTAGSDVKEKIGIGMIVDSSTNVLTYFQNFTNLPNTFFNLIENGKHIQLLVTYKSAAIAENYRYTILDEYDKPLSSGDFVKLSFETSELGIKYFLPLNEIENKAITLIVYNKDNPKITLTAIIHNKPLQKQTLNILSREYNEENKQRSLTIVDKSLELKTSSNPLVVSMDKTQFDYIYTLFVKDLSTNKVIFETQNWNYDLIDSDEGALPYINLELSNFKKSGKYEFTIQPKLRHVDEEILAQYATSKIIEIERKKEYNLTELLISFFSATAILLLIGFPLYRNLGRRKIQKEKFQKRLAETELKGIRSQLNPHFLFNSLASIQSLVNTNEIEQANKYISHFSKLTRSILDNQSYSTIQNEINLLTDYLEMENLRHNFDFHINSDENLDWEIEIPSMLLQPLLENAVVHGISTLEEGKIRVQFVRNNDDLIVRIEDNGNGFDSNKDFQGFGLKLTKERISLLNQMHKETTIQVNIDSTITGTKILFHFKNWLT